MTKTPTRVGRGPGRMAEDRGFEPLRAVNPTRIPSVRHRPLGESSVGNYTGSRAAARPSGKRARPDVPGRRGRRDCRKVRKFLRSGTRP